MKIHWSLFTNAPSLEKAEKLAEAFLEELHFPSTHPVCEAYHNGGYRCQLDTPIKTDSWEKAVFLSLWQAQQVGVGWVLSGDIEHEMDAWCNDCNMVGVTNMHALLLL